MARRRAAEEATRRGEQSGQPQEKKKRKRRVRYPKGFDPANPGPLPNPERWLPKWQRSDFKKKRNRRKEKASWSYGETNADTTSILLTMSCRLGKP